MITVIHDLAERVAIAAVTKAHGPVDEKFQARFRHNFQARLELKERRYPIYEALDTAFHEVLEAGFNASVVTSAAFGLPRMQADQRWDTPVSEEWQNTIAEVATPAAYEHLDAARRLFDSGQPLPATERLTDAITASIAAIAARKGWPHSNDMDIANAVTALATGQMPDETADLYEKKEHNDENSGRCWLPIVLLWDSSQHQEWTFRTRLTHRPPHLIPNLFADQPAPHLEDVHQPHLHLGSGIQR